MPDLSVPKMPPFVTKDFAEYVLVQWTDHPFWFVAFGSVLLVVAYRLAYLSGARRSIRRERQRVQAEQMVAAATRHDEWVAQRERLETARQLRVAASRMDKSEVA